ncbi:hypothetical protein PR202_gb25817 [Eleusine coracana subsp. coracana]|uniref:Uncharacterized protein n=1 Tax=Eleusine coracana subsp. coracana TaxID=191504 RepID=A0AAV5FPH4_ELECO|nr:hypothetical protein PR202_gb25781 [Eleusine coracana subsp. coracana]GJN36914.1 hypothetical protein PR202_gb25817 [Eleusine coracana subsp. coracana]
MSGGKRFGKQHRSSRRGLILWWRWELGSFGHTATVVCLKDWPQACCGRSWSQMRKGACGRWQEHADSHLC